MFTCFLMMQLEFSETGEFCKAVRAKDEGESMDLPSVQYKQHKAEAERMGAQRGGDGKGVKEEPRTRTKTEEGEEGGFEEEEEDAEEEETWAQKRAQSGEDRDLLHERSAGGGLGAVLDIARGRGLLGEEHESSGRMFDQKGAGLHNYDTKEADQETTFQLQYHDEYGRKMTQKQAFRQLSWKFHGKGPSKKNREKRMLEVEKQMAEKTQDRAMDYMHALQQAQQNTKSAHVVLSGVNAIKPTDVSRQRQAPDRAKLAKRKKSGGGGFESSIVNPGGGFASTIGGGGGFESTIG